MNYQNQSQANSKGYLNQVTLIESECEPRKKPANIPATVFNRSPLRDRESKSYVIQTKLIFPIWEGLQLEWAAKLHCLL